LSAEPGPSAAWAGETHREAPARMAGESAAAVARKDGFFMKMELTGYALTAFPDGAWTSRTHPDQGTTTVLAGIRAGRTTFMGLPRCRSIQ